MPRPRWIFGLSLLGVLVAGLAWACKVPVFRYALERWRHDRPEEQFRLTIFHDGRLPDLDDIDPRRGPRPNWTVEAVDLTGDLTDAQRALWAAQKDARTPWAVLRPPAESEAQVTLHSGPLDKAALGRWVDSPARRDVVERLMKGASFVWLLVESGDKDRDDAVAARIQTDLKRLEASTALPDLEDLDDADLLSKVPLRISFPLVRVSRQAAEEAEFLRQLHVLGEDLTDATGPVLFALYGRGRMLTGLREKEMTPRLFDLVTRTLCQACSCEIKRLNPGVDLLWLADWDSFVDGNVPPPTPEPGPVAVPLVKKPPEEAPPAPADNSAWFVGIGTAAVFVLLAAWWALRGGRL